MTDHGGAGGTSGVVARLSRRRLSVRLVVWAVAFGLPTGVVFGRASLQRPRADAAARATVGPAVFTDVTHAAGIHTSHAAQRDTRGSETRDYLATGQAWGDYDQDGWPDLYLTDQIGPNRLYRNVGDGSFEVSPVSGDVALPGATSGGAVFGDYDNDGYPDLYVVAQGADTLFHNDAGRGFSDVTERAGISAPRPGMSASWADYDRDGYLDLLVASYDCLRCNQPSKSDGAPLKLYRNNGNGTFADQSALLRSPKASGLSFVSGWVDYDDDRDLDLFVVNDVRGTLYLHGNALFRNDGPGCGGWCFTEVSEQAGAGQRIDGMGIAVADDDGDGDLDVFMTNTGWGVTPLTGPSVLLRNTGDGRFREVAAGAGAAIDAVTWGTVYLDYDNDGWQDLFVAVGLEDEWLLGEGSNRDRLLHNVGGGRFADTTHVSGTDRQTLDGLGVAGADFNGDGWPDLVVGNFDHGYRLYGNAAKTGTGNHRLAVRLRGAGPVNRDAVGTRVYVSTDDGRTQLQEIMAGASFGAGNDLTLSFGLGHSAVRSIRVVWPDGTEQSFAGVPSDVRWNFTYGGTPVITPVAASAVPASQVIPVEPSTRWGGLFVPALAVLTTLGLALFLMSRRVGRLAGVAAVSLQVLVVWAVAFQVGHLLEHVVQMGWWAHAPAKPPFVTPWGRVATDGFTEVVGHHGGRASGTELLHLSGNWIFFSGLLAATLATRSRIGGRGRAALRIAFWFQLVHLLEHIALTATWFLFDRPIGISTLFGWSFTLQGAWQSSIRVWWHFFMNLIPTVAAVVALWHFDFRRSRRFERRPRTNRRVYAAIFDALAWVSPLLVIVVLPLSVRRFHVEVGGALVVGVLAVVAQLAAGWRAGLYRRDFRPNRLRALGAAAAATVSAGWANVVADLVPHRVVAGAALAAGGLLVIWRSVPYLLAQRRQRLAASRERVLVFGMDSGDVALATEMLTSPFSPFEPVGFLAGGPTRLAGLDGLEVVGDWERLGEAAEKLRASGVVIATAGVGGENRAFRDLARSLGLSVQDLSSVAPAATIDRDDDSERHSSGLAKT